MKKLIIWFFITLGVIFFFLLLALSYLWVADPYELRPLISSYRQSASEPAPENSSSQDQEGVKEGEAGETVPTNPGDVNPNLTAAQEDALELVGINPAALPSEISDEQRACFERVLGADRVKAIMAGEAPSVVEILKANECL